VTCGVWRGLYHRALRRDDKQAFARLWYSDPRERLFDWDTLVLEYGPHWQCDCGRAEQDAIRKRLLMRVLYPR